MSSDRVRLVSIDNLESITLRLEAVHHDLANLGNYIAKTKKEALIKESYSCICNLRQILTLSSLDTDSKTSAGTTYPADSKTVVNKV